MKKGVLMIMCMMILTGCTINRPEISESTAVSSVSDELISPDEYISIEALKAALKNSEPVAMLDTKGTEKTSDSNAQKNTIDTMDVTLKLITSRESYFCFQYNVDNGREEYPVDVYTFRHEDGNFTLEDMMEKNPGLLEKMELSGKTVYCIEGVTMDWFNSYYFLMDKTLVQVNIDKNHDDDIEDIHTFVIKEFL